MDKCPVCGHVESTQQLVNSQVMNRYVRTKDKAVGVFNNGAEHFEVVIDTGKKDSVGEAVKEKLEWVREDIFNKPAPAPAKAVVEPALAPVAKPAAPAVKLG